MGPFSGLGKKIVDFVCRIQRLPGVGAGLAPVLEGQAVCRPSHLGGVYFLVCVFVGVVALIGSIVAILRCRFSLIALGTLAPSFYNIVSPIV